MTPGESRYPRIPYGVANFRRIRLERRLYVDKTRFLRALEEHDHAVLIRPRRFGKTCWVSLLEHYYDRAWAHEFDAVFGGTDIGRRPTEHRHRYVVLRFNFSTFKTALDGLEHHFEEYCQLRLRSALERNPDLFPEAAVRRIRRRREPLDDTVVAEKMQEATEQVRRYLADEGLRRRHPSVRHVGLAVVFHGWEMAACEAVDGESRGRP